MYLIQHATLNMTESENMSDLYSPDRTDRVTVNYCLGYLERLFNLILGSCGDGLFDEQCCLGEVLQDLELDIAARARGAAEHGGRADNNGAGTLTGRHVLDKVLEGLEDASVFIGRTDEGFAFLGEDSSGTVYRGVYERDNLETGTEFTEGVGECECKEALRRRRRTVRSGKSGSKDLHQSL